MPVSIEFLPQGTVLSAEVAAKQTNRNTPFQQCAQALLKHCPRGRFQTTIYHSSKHQKAKLEMTILPSLVDKIPLLADIRSSTTTASTTAAQPSKKKQKKNTEEASAISKASLESECSILAVISVLLLHEELVTVKDWLGDLSSDDNRLGDPERDLEFTVETLQVRPSTHSARFRASR